MLGEIKMLAQKEWKKPELSVYGSVEKLTEQSNPNITKNVGSGDTFVFIINNVSTPVSVPGNGVVKVSGL
ncbi:hypothetical protein B6N60_03320 [Richelia sinica FACHB-800]|uniref:Uncharacterized protein n=2 Tax=Richelia TaxID=98443 RepID=A0A975Y5V6_9NOST|nr:hypothetical protein B6N60_03320 [Richelia sinica FACHB-800]